jgi:uncharacterized protein (TIGR02996 family)
MELFAFWSIAVILVVSVTLGVVVKVFSKVMDEQLSLYEVHLSRSQMENERLRKTMEKERAILRTLDDGKTPLEHEIAFLRSIAELPFDPNPRQVYADWLEEQGRQSEAKVQREAITGQETRRDYDRSHPILQHYCGGTASF